MAANDIQRAFASSRNLFLTGPAGTGKSYALNEYIGSTKNVLVCAPTGIAAMNLGGDTMHRLFHIPVPCYETPSFAKGNKKAVPNATLKLLALADTVIIDEVSMARADVFRYAVKVLRKAEKLKEDGIRLIVSGDFSQLPPVLQKGDDKLLKKCGLDPSGFAFTTQEWKSLKFQVLELSDVKRQEDREFIEHLAAIRVGDFSDLAYFDQFVGGTEGFEGSIYICGTNAGADRMNMEYLDALPGAPVPYVARKEGRVPAGMVDDVLLLKPGARVVFTANDVRGQSYRNGTMGTVLQASQDAVVVESDGKPLVVRPLTRQVNSYGMSGGALVKKELGSVTQMPLKLARAITVHRSQGQTFDRAVVDPTTFAPGQLYVALSRVRSPEGLSLTRPIGPEDLILDGTVQKFYKNGYAWEPKKPVAKVPAKPARQSGAAKPTVKSTARQKPKASGKPPAKKGPAKKATARKTAPDKKKK